MKQAFIVVGLALISSVAAAIAAGSGTGSGDTPEIAVGVAVFAGLLSVSTTLMKSGNDRK